MRKFLVIATAAALLAGCATAPVQAPVSPDAQWIAAAVADPDRPHHREVRPKHAMPIMKVRRRP